MVSGRGRLSCMNRVNYSLKASDEIYNCLYKLNFTCIYKGEKQQQQQQKQQQQTNNNKNNNNNTKNVYAHVENKRFFSHRHI